MKKKGYTVPEHRVHSWTIKATFINKQNREKSKTENHQTRAIYTFLVISHISRSHDSDFKISVFN